MRFRKIRIKSKRYWKRIKKMWRSQTLPRPRPVDGPPIPPRHVTSTLSRSRDVDVQRLREDIDILSRQLRMVRAQLNNQIRDENRRSYHRPESADSRLSTTIFSPVSTRDTPTPLPTKTCPGSPGSRNSTMKRHSCFPGSKDNYHPSTISMMSVSVPSTSILVPRVKRRETFSKADNKQQYRRSSLQSSRMTSDSVGTFPPPKPIRTFAETLDSVLARRLPPPLPPKTKPVVNCQRYEKHSVSEVDNLEGEELAKFIVQKFEHGHCWFTKGDSILFVNPFSNISGDNHEPYEAIGNIVNSLLRRPAAALIFRGISGSGKSQLTEMSIYDVAKKVHVNGSALAVLMAVTTALRPLTTINSRRNNLSSRAVHHIEIHHRQGMMAKIRLRHFLLESPSRSSRANIFAMLASELKDKDKERLRLTGFYLREEYASYGNLEDFKAALTTLGINVQDVFSVISAITLMNNLCFKEIKGFVDIENIGDLEDAAHLLGVSSLSLYRTILNGSLAETTIAQVQRTRDELGASLFSRIVFLIVSRANRMLESFFETTDSTSTFNDSGVSIGSLHKHQSLSQKGEQNSVIRIIDVPGYCKASNNSITELLINTINDSLDGRQSKEAKKLLEKIEKAIENKTSLNRATYAVGHSNGGFPIEYDLSKMVQKNANTINKELIRLFDMRCCSFPFVNKLFTNDLELLKDGSTNYNPKAILFPKDESTVIQSVLALATDLQNHMDDCEIKVINTIKSNDKLEYARISEPFVLEQLSMLQTSDTSSQLSISIPLNNISLPPQTDMSQHPPPRHYELREGRIHKFPQRRNMIVDHIDHDRGVTITAGEVVKAIGFKGESYIIETGRGFRAKVPITFTEKSLPPTEGYNV